MRYMWPMPDLIRDLIRTQMADSQVPNIVLLHWLHVLNSCGNLVVLLYSAGMWQQRKSTTGGTTSLHSWLWHVSSPRFSVFLTTGSLCWWWFYWWTAASCYWSTQWSPCTATCLYCPHCPALTYCSCEPQVRRSLFIIFLSYYIYNKYLFVTLSPCLWLGNRKCIWPEKSRFN